MGKIVRLISADQTTAPDARGNVVGLETANARRRRRDFPYYAGQPVSLGMGAWTLLLLSVLASYALVSWVPLFSIFDLFLSRLLFAGIPFAILVGLVGRDCQALFGRFGLREAAVCIGAGLLAVVASIAAALVVGEFAPLSPNPVSEFLATQPPREFVQLLLILLPQLLGEELLTMLPFLAILQLTASHWGWRRRSSIALALLGSTLLFSAGHLPTYDWNWAQCFGVIGAARVVWTLAYIATRSLWVSIGAHILTDGVAIILALLAAEIFPWTI